MAHWLANFSDDSEPFRLHLVTPSLRSVVAYDSLEDALEGASERLGKNPDLCVWISDPLRNVILDNQQVRNELTRKVI